MSILQDLQNQKNEIETKINSLVSKENAKKEEQEKREREKRAIELKREADLAQVNVPRIYVEQLLEMDLNQINYDLLKDLFILTLHLLTKGEAKLDTREYKWYMDSWKAINKK